MPTKKTQAKTIHVSPIIHSEVKDFLEKQNMGGDIGKFFERGARELLQKEKQTIENPKNKKP